jgi:serine/threonine protein kinase
VTQRVAPSAFESAARSPRYEALFELEQSGCARSYLAIDHGGPSSLSGPRGDRLVVVHVLPPSFARDPDFSARFVARAAGLLSVAHPNLVRTLDVVADGQRCHWVSEFIQGHTLASLVAKRKDGERALTLRQHLTILCEVLRGLEHAHRVVDASGTSRPLVHRHLSPTSVLVSYEGKVKITDAALCEAPQLILGRFDAEAERLAYQAPEWCLGGAGDPRSDIFAVGALLWEAVCGRSRPVGASVAEALDMCENATQPEFGPPDADISPTLVAITRRALAKDPNERYQSARELRLGLEAQMPPVPASRDRGSLFAFMCNHFHEEHEVLQRLLESRAPGVLEGVSDAESELDRVSAALSSPPPLSGVQPPAGISRAGRRLRQGGAVASIVGAGVLAFVLVQGVLRQSSSRQGLGQPQAPDALVQSLRSLSAPPSALLSTGSVSAAAPMTQAGAARPPATAAAVPSVSTPAAAASSVSTPTAPALAARAVVPPPPALPPASAASDALSARVATGAPSSEAREPSPEAASEPADAPARQGLDLELDPRLNPGQNDGAGVDLRSLRRRAPRPIDKADPYTR